MSYVQVTTTSLLASMKQNLGILTHAIMTLCYCYLLISHRQRKTHVGENGGVNSSLWITLQISHFGSAILVTKKKISAWSPKFDVLNPREANATSPLYLKSQSSWPLGAGTPTTCLWKSLNEGQQGSKSSPFWPGSNFYIIFKQTEAAAPLPFHSNAATASSSNQSKGNTKIYRQILNIYIYAAILL